MMKRSANESSDGKISAEARGSPWEHEAEALGEPDLSEAFPAEVNLERILDIPVTASLEIGRTRIAIADLLRLRRGSVLELDSLAGEPLDLLVNGTPIARGEVVVVNDRYGVRLTEVIGVAERVRKLK